jgi:predicted permease
MRDTGRQKSRSTQVFRVLLALYPSHFRDEYGREIALVFADRHRDAEGFWEHAEIWGRAILGLLKEAPKEHTRMIRQDLQYALRTFRMNPSFVATVVMTLALGIGASTTVFTLLDRVLLRVLPVADPHELVQVTSRGSRLWSSWGDGSELSYPMYTDLRDNSQVFAGMLCRFPFTFHLAGGARSERVAGEIVSGTYFPMLGVRAALGRTLAPEDDRLPGGHPVAVLSHTFWTSRFARDPSVLDRVVVVNGRQFNIVGVAQEGFDGIELGKPTQVFVPMMMSEQLIPSWSGLSDRHYDWVKVFARLKKGVSMEQAQTALQPLYHSRLAAEVRDQAFATTPALARQQILQNRLEILPAAQGRSGFRQRLTKPLWVLMIIAAGVLLIACANVANLLLVRVTSRQREMAIRLALGASRRRLALQVLVESALLALGGGMVGIVLGVVGAPVLLRFFVLPETPQPISTSVDARILAFTIGISMLTAVLFGLAPAIQWSRPKVASTLKDEAGGIAGGTHARLRNAFVVSQVGLSIMLIIGAVLFIRTLNNVLAVDLGVETHRLFTFSIDPSLNGYTRERTSRFSKDLLEQLRSIPGVVAAGLASRPILDGNQWSSGMSVEGYTPKPDEDMNQQNNAVSPGYFRAMGIPLLRGRDFDASDERSAPPAPGQLYYRVAVVNERFAKRYFGDSNPIGRRVGFGFNRATAVEIVGVVRDSKYTGVRGETERQVFVPFFESPSPRLLSSFTIYVSTDRHPTTVFSSVRQIVQQLDPDLPMYGLRTLEQQLAQSVSNERFLATLASVFGVFSTLLAVIGVYSVTTSTVQRRTREIGVRMALGATASNVCWFVVRDPLKIATIGIVCGVVAVSWLGRYIASELYGVTATDPSTFLAASVGVAAVVALAALLPASRAARIEPTNALRL